MASALFTENRNNPTTKPKRYVMFVSDFKPVWLSNNIKVKGEVKVKKCANLDDLIHKLDAKASRTDNKKS